MWRKSKLLSLVLQERNARRRRPSFAAPDKPYLPSKPSTSLLFGFAGPELYHLGRRTLRVYDRLHRSVVSFSFDLTHGIIHPPELYFPCGGHFKQPGALSAVPSSGILPNSIQSPPTRISDYFNWISSPPGPICTIEIPERHPTRTSLAYFLPHKDRAAGTWYSRTLEHTISHILICNRTCKTTSNF